MIKLKNIKRTENIISCDYYPEGSNLRGYVSVNVENGGYVSLCYSEYEHGKKTYAGKTRNKLLELAEKKDLPEEYVSMWY